MRVGDIFEWLAATGLTAGLYLQVGRSAALFGGAACLAYFGQCYGGVRIPLPRRNKAEQQQ